MAFEVPALPYAYEALEPYIDAQTMHLHHDKHHQAYVDNFNAALEKAPELKNKGAEEILKNLTSVPEAIRTAVRNHGGGHVNHSMFWTIMGPKAGGAPRARLPTPSKKHSVILPHSRKSSTMPAPSSSAAGGSGWSSGAGGLQVISTPNQDNPLSQGLYPVMGNDVWARAYYLKYQNRRAEYLKAWWNVVNWSEVNKRFEKAP